MAKKAKTKKAEDYLDKVETFVKKNPITSTIGALIIGYSIGKLIYKRSKK